MKKLSMVLTVVCMVIMFSIQTNATDALSLNIENYRFSNNELSVYVNSNAEEFEKENVTAILGGDKVSVTSKYSIAETQENSTYVFMIDVSGSLKTSQLNDIKEMLYQFVEEMSVNDNACFMTLGNELNVNPFVSTKEEMIEQIDQITGAYEDTNLYAGIVQALNIIDTDNEVKNKRSLIIISDGADDYSEGYTKDEVIMKIEESNVPISTIAMLSSSSSDASVEASKVLSSFARLSAGGVENTYGTGSTITEIVDDIMTVHKSTQVVTIEYDELDLTSDKTLLKLTLELSSVGTVSDEIYIDSADIKNYMASGDEEDAEATEDADAEGDAESDAEGADVENSEADIETEEVLETEDASDTDTEDDQDAAEEDEEDEEGLNLIFIAAGAAGTILLLGLIIIILVSKKKKKGRIEITFEKLGESGNNVYKYIFKNEFLIGKNMKKKDNLFSVDSHLSMQHCIIVAKGDGLYLNDLGSTNGTYFNGIPVKSEVMIQQGSIILVGSMELKVEWRAL